MARKNNLRAETTSSAIHFDASTRTVMAEATHENIKEKVQAVREVVPGKSNNEVILVLQYYDYCVERTIQAYLEDGAKAALQEWNFTGTKQPNKKRKNKKKAGAGAGGGPNGEKQEPASTSSSTTAATAEGAKSEGALNGEAGLPNGDVPHDGDQAAVASTTAVASQSQNGEATTAAPLPQRQPHSKGRGHTDKGRQRQHQHTNHPQQDPRERTISEVSTGSGIGEAGSKRPFHGLEKAMKDLHRQTTSLERLRNLLDHEIDRSYRSVKSVFEELRQGLNSREAQLCEEMDKLKKEASEMLEMRQGKAADLKRQVDRAERMSETEVSELRAEVKNFVSERRHDEELGRATRFVYDSDHLLEEINKFGEVVHVKSAYTARRASTSSIASSVVSHDGNTESESPTSQEVNELQDRLKNSLKLQTTQSPGPSSLQNGTSETEFLLSKSSRRRPGNSHRGNGNRPGGSGSPDVNSNRTPSAQSNQRSTSEKYNSDNHSNSNGPSGSNYHSSNTGSPGRGGNRSAGPRGRGARGGPGRGGGQRGQGQRPQSSQGASRGGLSASAQSGEIAVST